MEARTILLGLPGVKLMHDEAMGLPINIFVQMPSCVPSAPGLEHAGAELSVEVVAEAMAWPNIIGLGEMMNFPGVAANDALGTAVASGKLEPTDVLADVVATAPRAQGGAASSGARWQIA